MKKGMSPIISVPFIMLLTIIVAGIVSDFSINLVHDTTQSVGNTTTIAIDCTVAQITIEDVYFDSENNKTRVSVKNSGYTNDKIISVNVLNNWGISAINITQFPITIEESAYETIEFNTASTVPLCGNFSKVIVSTVCVLAVFDSTPKNC